MKTRLQLQAPGHGTQKPYTGVAGRSISRTLNNVVNCVIHLLSLRFEARSRTVLCPPSEIPDVFRLCSPSISVLILFLLFSSSAANTILLLTTYRCLTLMHALSFPKFDLSIYKREFEGNWYSTICRWSAWKLTVSWVDALRSIVREEGLRGLYKGLGPGLLLVSTAVLWYWTIGIWIIGAHKVNLVLESSFLFCCLGCMYLDAVKI